QIRDFASHVMQVSARSDSNPLSIVKVDKQTWQVNASGTVTVEYTTYWDDPGPFASQLNSEHAFLNLAMMLLYIPERRGEETHLVFDDLPPNWRVAVELNMTGAAAQRHTATFTAPTYDALVDAPAELGQFEELRVVAAGKPIRVVIHGDSR